MYYLPNKLDIMRSNHIAVQKLMLLDNVAIIMCVKYWLIQTF